MTKSQLQASALLLPIPNCQLPKHELSSPKLNADRIKHTSMLLFIYNIFLIVFTVLYFPFHLIRLIWHTKYRNSTFARLGFQKISQFKGEETFWIHSVSVGESQVAGTLIKELKKQFPNCKCVISTITETGQAVAKKTDADATFYYPVDISFLIKPILKKLSPKAIIIVETDIWLNQINIAKKLDIPVYLVNGKLSQTSHKRYKQFPKVAKVLTEPFDHFFVQSEAYQERFLDTGLAADKLTISGNIKLDNPVPRLTAHEQDELRKSFGLIADKPMIIFGSTHAGEEELCIETMQKLWQDNPELQCVLVPRHPERFKGVAELLKQNNIEFNQASQLSDEVVNKNFLLLDQMGQLMKFYTICDIAIVAGSFTPHVGGHNILEPSFYGKPFIYGPWIYKQPGFHQMNLEYQAGLQCQPEELASTLTDLLNSEEQQKELGENGLKLIEISKGATKRIVREIKSLL